MSNKFFFRIIELVALIAFFVYMYRFGIRLVRAFPTLSFSPGFTLFLVIVPIMAYIAADFVSGFVHFLADNFGSDTTWFFGQKFIHPFREHHVDPTAITRHSFLEVNGDSCIVALLVLLPTYYTLPVGASQFYLAMGVFVIFFLSGIFLTNQIHRWAHTAVPPRFVAWLQNKRLILSPAVHNIHHTAPFATYYCITSGWLNPLLARLGIFERKIKE